MVHNHQRHVAQLGLGANFVELAAAHERRGVELFAHLQNAAGNFRAGRFGKFVQFFQRIAARSRRIAGASTRRFLQADANEQHAFAIVHRLRGFHADGLALAPSKLREILFIGNSIIRRMCEEQALRISARGRSGRTRRSGENQIRKELAQSAAGNLEL